MKVSFNPTGNQIIEIKNWLMKERSETGEGFYCNWRIIKNSFSKNELATISKNNKTVGFVIWNNIADFSVTIDIAEIKPTYRKKGLGQELISQLINHLTSMDIFVLYLECMPESSESFWRQLGFTDFPARHYESFKRNRHMYKVIVPHLLPTENYVSIDLIEIWDKDPLMVNDLPATWVWSVKFDEGTRKFHAPIIFPCCHDWRIRWKRDGIVMRDDKIKCFSKERILFGAFLILDDFL